MATNSAFKFYSSILLLIVLFISSVLHTVNAAPIFEDPNEPVEILNDLYVDATLASKHFATNDSELNERNLGLGVTFQRSQFLEFKLGFYDNSYNKTSTYALVNLIPYSLDNTNRTLVLNFGAAFGVVTGYKDTNGEANRLSIGNMQLGAALSTSLKYTPWKTRATLALVGNAVALQVSYQVK